MKQNIFKRAGGGLLAAALVAFAPNASALVLSYEDTTSGRAIGTPFTGGDFRINLQNFDMGSTYPDLAVGASVGFGQGGASANRAAGTAALNGIQVAPATGRVGAEDTWGIARILTITDAAGAVIWSEPVKNAQITAMFYGEQDFYVQQLANGFQHINGVGLNVDFYFQSKAVPTYTAYNPLLGSAGRTGLDTYTSVTDGQQFLRTTSTGGFLHPAGTLGGLTAEFLSVYNATSGGTGQTYLNVIGGTDAAQFNTNGYVSPFGTGNTADLFAAFTTTPTTVSNWLVASNDPISGNLASVPDGGSTLLMLGAGLILLGLRQQRKNGKA